MIDEKKLIAKAMQEISFDKSFLITSLKEVDYGIANAIKERLDIKELTGKDVGVRFVDVNDYVKLNVDGNKGLRKVPDAIMINVLKTKISDSRNIYIAISPEVNDSSLIHELAHALDYLTGGVLPAFARALSLEYFLPLEHLEHPYEFGKWFSYLRDKFHVIPDAEDTIVCILYEEGLLIKNSEIKNPKGEVLKRKSDAIIRYLSENSEKIHSIIKDLPGYLPLLRHRI